MSKGIDNSGKTIFLLGDSHSLQFVHAVKEVFNKNNIIINTHSGTPFSTALISVSKIKPEKHNLKLYRNQLQMMEYLNEKIKAKDIVIISNYYQKYYGNPNNSNKIMNMFNYDPNSMVNITKKEAFNNWKNQWKKLILTIKNAGAKIIIIQATPELNNTYNYQIIGYQICLTK